MLNIYKTEGGRVVPQDQLTPGCWVNVVEPTQQEIAYPRPRSIFSSVTSLPLREVEK